MRLLRALKAKWKGRRRGESQADKALRAAAAKAQYREHKTFKEGDSTHGGPGGV